MSVTQPVNSKANIKKTSSSDVPYSINQPVMNEYEATSTLNQTVISLSFSVDQSATSNFMLFVNGVKLRLGASHDFVFTSIGSDNTSSQVTLNYGLSANLNIYACKLGLKKESEFQTDNRFVQMYQGQTQGFRGFVSSESTISATTSVGAPVAGTFYSSIQNRASIIDLTQDLKARMGIDRVVVPGLFLIPTEFGVNGESVFGVTNDKFGQIRFVGSWSSLVTTNGVSVQAGTTSDYTEITFVGTGLNVMALLNTSGLGLVAAVDGGAEGSNLISLAYSGVLATRNYSTNQVVPVVSGLAYGVHTVKIRNSAGTNQIYGFEVVNSSSTISVSPGVSYASGKKAVAAGVSSLAYNSSFESGVIGTRGGRVVVYQKADGTIAKSVQPVNAAQANLTSADHSNEEVSRIYYPREFGAGRTDDVSRLSTSSTNVAFTLNDGTTSVASLNGQMNHASTTPYDSLVSALGTANYTTFTFVGTGLDLMLSSDASAGRGFSILVDGVSIGSYAWAPVAGALSVKIVSGLPYGTHSVKLTNTSAANVTPGIVHFKVYQPKKPTVPVGSIELADYNVMADYNSSNVTGTAATDHYQIPSGVIFKTCVRESIYSGANWSVSVASPVLLGGFSNSTTTNTQPVSYTFFGTGFMLLMRAHTGGTYDYSVTVDGVLNASGVGKSNASNLGSGSYRSTSTTADAPSRVEFTGLTLGIHTVVVQRIAGAGNLNFDGIHIITPIHATKSSTEYDQQNTMPVGSQGLSDSRAMSPLKDSQSQVKNVSQATGVISGPTTTSTIFVPMPDMSVVHNNKTGRVKISYSVTCFSTGNGTGIQPYAGGLVVGNAKSTDIAGTNNFVISDSFVINVSPGVQKYDLYWVANGTLTGSGTRRNITVEDV